MANINRRIRSSACPVVGISLALNRIVQGSPAAAAAPPRPRVSALLTTRSPEMTRPRHEIRKMTRNLGPYSAPILVSRTRRSVSRHG
jgi:hypothetical protein